MTGRPPPSPEQRRWARTRPEPTPGWDHVPGWFKAFFALCLLVGLGVVTALGLLIVAAAHWVERQP